MKSLLSIALAILMATVVFGCPKTPPETVSVAPEFPAEVAPAAEGEPESPATITPTTPLPAPNVKVEIYLHDPDADPDEGLPPVAESFTDDTGSYLLILPAAE